MFLRLVAGLLVLVAIFASCACAEKDSGEGFRWSREEERYDRSDSVEGEHRYAGDFFPFCLSFEH